MLTTMISLSHRHTYAYTYAFAGSGSSSKVGGPPSPVEIGANSPVTSRKDSHGYPAPNAIQPPPSLMKDHPHLATTQSALTVSIRMGT